MTFGFLEGGGMNIPPAGPYLFAGGYHLELDAWVVEVWDCFLKSWVCYPQEEPLPGFSLDSLLDVDGETLLAACRSQNSFFLASTVDEKSRQTEVYWQHGSRVVLVCSMTSLLGCSVTALSCRTGLWMPAAGTGRCSPDPLWVSFPACVLLRAPHLRC